MTKLLTGHKLNFIADSESEQGFQTLASIITFMIDCFCDNPDTNYEDFIELRGDISGILNIIGKHMSDLNDIDEEFVKLVSNRFIIAENIFKVAKDTPEYEQTVYETMKTIIRL